MCWVAADRGAKLAQVRDDDERMAAWRKAADEIHADVCARGTGSDDDMGTTFSANVTMCSLQVYTSPSAMTGRPRKVAPVGLETGKRLMGIRRTHVAMT
jgi:GH15 family glucan-1,4-alpha-glucosidase